MWVVVRQYWNLENEATLSGVYGPFDSEEEADMWADIQPRNNGLWTYTATILQSL